MLKKLYVKLISVNDVCATGRGEQDARADDSEEATALLSEAQEGSQEEQERG